MRAHIFIGPLEYDIDIVEPIAPDDVVIGADQGALFLMQNKLRCDVALGDFDSVSAREQTQIEQYADEVIVHPSIKNHTDTYLAVQEAFKRGCHYIIIYGGIGKRFDHSYANLQLLQLGNITIKTATSMLYVLNPGEYKIPNEYTYISFFALEDVQRLSLKGFQYELDNINLTIYDPLCISNQGEGSLSFDEGLLLVIHQQEQ